MTSEQIKVAREALSSMDDYARMNTGVDAIGPRGVLERFISEAERTTAPATTPDTSQDWAKLDGAVAWHLIERHADSWSEVGNMMESWLAARMAAAPAPIQKEPEADNTSAWTALQEILESKVTADNPEAFRLKMIAVDAFTGHTPPALAGSQVQAAGDAAPIPGLPFADLATAIKEFEAKNADQG